MHQEQPFQLQPPDSPSVPHSARTSAPYGTLDLRLGDCMDLMRDTPNGFFDLAIVDPPYGIGESGSTNSSRGKEPPSIAYFNEIRRVSRNQIIWNANHFIERLPVSSSCWIVWDKKNDGFSFADAELAWTNFATAVRCFRFAHGQDTDKRIHPTQKPVALYRWLLANYAQPGQCILDTHLGSGSIAIACRHFGTHLTATEIDPDYYAAACQLIERETRQLGIL